MMRKIISKLSTVVAKGIIKAVSDDSDFQLVKVSVLSDETIEGVERIQPYGLTSVPPSNSEAVLVFINNNREHGVVIACDSSENRPRDNEDGDVVVYSKHGQQIKLGSDTNTVATQEGTFNVGTGSDFVALASKVDTLWTTFWNMFNAWIPSSPDGGAALKAQFQASFPTTPTTVASLNLKAD